MTLPSRLLIRAACVAAALGFAPFTALATDGYFVQGFGAVNSALGGAATAGNADDLDFGIAGEARGNQRPHGGGIIDDQHTRGHCGLRR